jgi:hypothetical protein
MRWWSEWRDERALRLRADAYVRTLRDDPAPDDVRWLAEHGTSGDTDHALWELRYARLAVGYLVSQRDALDDRTAAAVARSMTASLATDRRIDAAKLRTAERQLNDRLRAFSEAAARRDDAGALHRRLARVMLAFAGVPDAPELLQPGAAAIIAKYLAACADRLGETFGVAALPDQVAPSQVPRSRAG